MQQGLDDSGRKWRYGHVAWCYDLLGFAYSLGAIGRSKRWYAGLVSEGDRVLFVGAGTGREVGLALEWGARVTCLEPCPSMLRRLVRRWGSKDAAQQLTIQSERLESARFDERFDLVVAHYFLNMFGRQEMEKQLERLVARVGPGGRVVVSDFSRCVEASWVSQVLAAGYYWPVNLVGAGLRICAAHPVWDYQAELEKRGFVVHDRARFDLLPGLSGVGYEVIVARREKV